MNKYDAFVMKIPDRENIMLLKSRSVQFVLSVVNNIARNFSSFLLIAAFRFGTFNMF